MEIVDRWTDAGTMTMLAIIPKFIGTVCALSNLEIIFKIKETSFTVQTCCHNSEESYLHTHMELLSNHITGLQVHML